MKDLKIKIDNNLDELIELFCQLGFKYFNHTCSVKNYLICESGKIFFCKLDKNFKASNAKEITIEQLKDMVILSRNDSNDANVHQEGDVPCLYDLYLTNDNELYFYHCGKEKWILSNLNDDEDYYKLLKPIQADKVEVKVDNVSEKLSKVDETLKERQSQYGCFEDVAFVTQGFIEIMNKCRYKEMPQPHQMALYMIASKMARLVNGDCNHKDSWHDIGGYAKLIEDLIGDNS